MSRYACILADPPWRFATWSQTRQTRAASNHYRTMSLPEIKALPVADLAAPDCALLMWATFPMLLQATDLMAAWGFKYKTGGAWAKMSKNGNPAFGTGYIYRSAAELWLLGTRGKPVVRSRSVRNLIIALRREHSRKPDEMYAEIERLVAGPYVELFARQRRPGWDVAFSDEADKFEAAA